MTERRARGTSPAGRGDRRSSRSSPRSERSGGGSARATGGKRAARGSSSQRGSGTRGSNAQRGSKTQRGSTTKNRSAAPSRSATTTSRAPGPKPKKAASRSDRRILGLSTGRAVILAAVLCALALTLAVPMRTYFSQRSEAAQLAEQREDLQNDLTRLRARREQQSDPAYIRSEARSRLRLVMPGDTAYIVQVPGMEQPNVPVPATESSRPDPWYTQLWHSMSAPQPDSTTAPPEGEPR